MDDYQWKHKKQTRHVSLSKLRSLTWKPSRTGWGDRCAAVSRFHGAWYAESDATSTHRTSKLPRLLRASLGPLKYSGVPIDVISLRGGGDLVETLACLTQRVSIRQQVPLLTQDGSSCVMEATAVGPGSSSSAQSKRLPRRATLRIHCVGRCARFPLTQHRQFGVLTRTPKQCIFDAPVCPTGADS